MFSASVSFSFTGQATIGHQRVTRGVRDEENPWVWMFSATTVGTRIETEPGTGTGTGVVIRAGIEIETGTGGESRFRKGWLKANIAQTSTTVIVVGASLSTNKNPPILSTRTPAPCKATARRYQRNFRCHRRRR